MYRSASQTIITPSLTLMTLYSQCTVCQGEVGCGGWVGGRQYLRAGGAVPSPHQQEASRRSPAGVLLPSLQLQHVTLLPARASQGDAAGKSSIFFSTVCHRPVLGVATPGGGERRKSAGEGDSRGREHLHWCDSIRSVVEPPGDNNDWKIFSCCLWENENVLHKTNIQNYRNILTRPKDFYIPGVAKHLVNFGSL